MWQRCKPSCAPRKQQPTWNPRCANSAPFLRMVRSPPALADARAWGTCWAGCTATMTVFSWNMHGQGGEEADRPGRRSVCSLSTLSFTHARALAGRFSSAARRLADLRKALDADAGQGGGKACQLDPDHQTLAEACAGCARDLEEVCACCCKYTCATPQEAVCCARVASRRMRCQPATPCCMCDATRCCWYTSATCTHAARYVHFL